MTTALDHEKSPTTLRSRGSIASAGAFGGDRVDSTLAEGADSVERGRSGHLALRHRLGHRAAVFRKKLPLSEHDVDTMMGALFEIRANTDEILELLRDDDGEEEEEGFEDA